MTPEHDSAAQPAMRLQIEAERRTTFTAIRCGSSDEVVEMVRCGQISIAAAHLLVRIGEGRSLTTGAVAGLVPDWKGEGADAKARRVREHLVKLKAMGLVVKISGARATHWSVVADKALAPTAPAAGE